MSRFDAPEPDKYYVYHPPTCDMEDSEVEAHEVLYSVRPAGSFVVSGPIAETDELCKWPGRRFSSFARAEYWIISTYGKHYGAVREMGTNPGESPDRWGFVVMPRSKP
jgi:hypothetical protein